MMDFLKNFFASFQKRGIIYRNGVKIDDIAEMTVPQGIVLNNTDESTKGPNTDTRKCLIEFDGILAEMKGAIPDEPMTLDEIEDVLNIKENEDKSVEPLEISTVEDMELIIPKFEIFPDLELQEINNFCDGNFDNKIDMLEEYKNTQDYFVKIEPDEVISISSDGSQVNERNDEANMDEIESDDCGYHSSDFEFITEDEAKMDGLIINYNHNMTTQLNKSHKVKTIEITLNQSKIHDRTKLQKNISRRRSLNGSAKENIPLGPSKPKIEVKDTEFCTEINKPEISIVNSEMNFGPGLNSQSKNMQGSAYVDPPTNNIDSRLNNESNIWPETYENNEHKKKTGYGPSNLRNNDAEIQKWRSYQLRRKQFGFPDYSRENRRIPNAEELYSLFHPNLGPLPSRFMENKSVRSSSKMARFEGIGFDMTMLRQNEAVDEEVKKNAAETRRKVMEMYPAENGRRRLRRRF